MFSYRWFENNFSYPANQPKRNKKRKKKKAGSCCERSQRAQAGEEQPCLKKEG